jgi:hypothetical protein
MTPPQVICAVASIRTGSLLDDSEQGEARTQLEGLAATLPDLFGTVDPSCLERISERLGGTGSGHGQTFAEILVLSEKHVHVIQPLTARPGTALLAVGAADSSIGLVLSAVRTQVAALEDE